MRLRIVEVSIQLGVVAEAELRVNILHEACEALLILLLIGREAKL